MRWRDLTNLPPLPSGFFGSRRRVHFIGIGGIGMSSLALVLASRGHEISGSDVADGPILEKLRRAGMHISIGHSAAALGIDILPDAVFFNSAIATDNPEWVAAQEHNIPLWHRSHLLAYFVNSARHAIAVSGTHGKSTTSAMIAHILERSGFNPTAILGAVYRPFESNARIGDPDLVVVEADESDGSFTLLHPTVTVVTNVEPEHLENYDDSEAELWRAFDQFVAHTRVEIDSENVRRPAVVLNADDVGAWKRLAPQAKALVAYSLELDRAQPAPAPLMTLTAGAPTVVDRWTEFDLHSDAQPICLTRSGVPGRHNIGNALAAIAAANLIGVPLREAAAALADFHGVARRFEFIGHGGDIVVYEDYGHHPTEVASTLAAAAEFLRRPLTVVFQPHRYSRTQQLGPEFGPSFAAADIVVITELYSAFETPIPGVSGRIVFDAVRRAFPDKPVHFAANLDEAHDLALQLTRPGSAIMAMGAGDVGKLAPRLVQSLGAAAQPAAVHTEAAPAGDQPIYETAGTRREALARHTTMRVGGPTAWWFEAADEDALVAALQDTGRRGYPVYVLGAGSNLVVGDSGFDGLVLKLGAGFAGLRVEGERLIAGGGMLLPRLTHTALSHGLGNMEWACGIPGTVGGSIWGNAGARGFDGEGFASRDCAADLESLIAYDRTGKRSALQRGDLEFAYRKSSLGDLIVTEATFRLRPLDAAQLERHRAAVRELLQIRRQTQPVNAACAGCIWKNPKDAGCRGAGELIERLGLKGHAVGDAAISDIHANFIVNRGHATGADIRRLIDEIEALVFERAGVKLEREVRFLGDSADTGGVVGGWRFVGA